MVDNYFEQARQLAEELRRLGLANEGQALVDAIDAGSTGTEIHMALRHELRKVVNDARLGAPLRATAAHIVETITTVLGM